MFKNYSILLVIVLLQLMACSSSNKLSNSKSEIIPTLNLDLKDNSKIAFLTFNMSLLDSIKDTYSFTLVNKICSKGVLKKQFYTDEVLIEKNYLYIQCSNTEGQVSKWIKVNDPLNMVYEYPASENNDLGKAVFASKQGILTFRFQCDSSYNFLSIYKPTTDLQLKKIYYAAL